MRIYVDSLEIVYVNVGANSHVHNVCTSLLEIKTQAAAAAAPWYDPKYGDLRSKCSC